MSKRSRNKAYRLAQGCRRLADLVERHRIPMKKFRRNCVFTTEGVASCPFGHAIVIADIKPKGNYRFREHRRAMWQPVYETNEKSFELVVGRKPSPELEEKLWYLAACNAVERGEKRRRAVVACLRDIAQELG